MASPSNQQRLLMLSLSLKLEEDLAYYDLMAAALIYNKKKNEACAAEEEEGASPAKKRRRFWVNPWLYARKYFGQFKILMEELLLKDEAEFKNFTRMEPNLFFSLLSRLEPRIAKKDTFWREALSPGFRFAVAAKYYATGHSFRSMAQAWLAAPNTISKIVRDVSEAIIAEFGEEVMKTPSTEEEWLKVSSHFERRWNFEHTLGALDGKHVAITKPQRSGSLYYNYKGFYSIILMALVDADYKFLWVDAGTNGACSDAQIWNACELQEAFKEGTIGVPAPCPLVEGERDIPFFIVGDDAFALRSYMMKPHGKRELTKEERIFNYRLSRARRIVENAFGILANRFGCLLTTMKTTPENATSTVLACCCLHNILRAHTSSLPVTVDTEDEDHNLVPGTWRDERTLLDGEKSRGKNTATQDAKMVRQYLTTYYSSKYGAVEWQDRMI